ncbi:MAG: Abortive infection protein [Akkermansiaceae bacterium]|nr:Abortive infection protein [Akkermansiaceae bacterium]
MSLPPFSEALLIQLVFVTALGIFAISAIVRLAGKKNATAPEEELPQLESGPPRPLAPPPLPPQEEYSRFPRVAPVAPYEPPAAEVASPYDEEEAPLAGPLKVSTRWYHAKDLGGIAFFVFLYFIMQLGSGDKSGGKAPEEKYTAGVLLISIGFQLFCGAIAVGIMIGRVNPVRWLGLRWRRWPLAFAIAPLSVLSIWIFTAILALTGWNAWLQDQLHAEPVQEAVQLLMKSQNTLVLALMSFSAAIAAPLVEETIFRGYLYPVAKRYCGPAAAMVFSSMVFAGAHGSSVALVPLFVLALLLCNVYERTGSLWAPISVHFLFNSATVGIQLMARQIHQ